MKTSTKKLLIALTALLCAFVMVFAVACKNDPFAGNYKEISKEEREEFVKATAKKLDELEEMKNYKCTYVVKFEDVTNGQKSSSNIELTLIVEGDKVRADIKYDESYKEETLKFSGTVWIDLKAQDAFYKLTIDGKTEEGKYNIEGENAEEIRTAIMMSSRIAGQSASFVNNYKDAIDDEDAKLYVDGENFKIVSEETDEGVTSKSEIIFVFEKDGSYRFKAEMSESYEDGEDKGLESYSITLEPSTEKVTMPDYK